MVSPRFTSPLKAKGTIDSTSIKPLPFKEECLETGLFPDPDKKNPAQARGRAGFVVRLKINLWSHHDNLGADLGALVEFCNVLVAHPYTA